MATVLRSRGALTRLFEGKSGRILNNTIDLGTRNVPKPQLVATNARQYSNYAKSPFVTKITEQYNYNIEKSPPEWMYVQRLLPFETVPRISQKETYPSGWVPPKEESKNLPYFIQRTKNSEIPIYLSLTFRGWRKISKVKKIDGDIWLLNEDIKHFLHNKYNQYVETRVHELGRFIEVKGDYVVDLKKWALGKGF